MELDRVTCRGVVVGLLLLTIPAGVLAQGRTGSQTEAQQALADGNVDLKRGNHKAAHASFEKAIAKDPRLAEAYERYSMSLFSLKKYREGSAVARRGLTQLPDSAPIKAALGMNLFRLGQRKEARTYLKPAVSGMPTRFEVQAAAATCCLDMEDYPCAIDALKNFLSYRPSKLAKRDFTFKALLGKSLLKDGQLKEAKQVLQQVLRRHPNDVTARLAMAEVHLTEGDCSRAVAGFERLLREKQGGKEIHLHLGKSYLCGRRYRDALRQGDFYVKDHPKSVEGLLLRGDAAEKLRQYDRALADFNRAAAIAGQISDVQLRIAGVYYSKKMYSKALQQVQPQLAKAGKANPGVVMLALRAAIRTKKKQLALDYATRLLKTSDPTAEMYYVAGMAHSSAGQFSEAITLYEKALKQAKDHRGATREMVKAQCYLARAAVNEKQLAAAVGHLKRAYAADPRSLVANRNLALVYLQQRQGEKALEHLKVILTKVPTDFVANRLAGRALAQMDKLTESVPYLNMAVNAVEKRYSGPLLARALAERAVIQLRLKQVDVAITGLERARGEATGQANLAGLLNDIQRNLARAYVLKAQELLAEDKNKEAWAQVQKALQASAGMSPNEKAVVEVAAALTALSARQVATGKEMIKRLKGSINKVLVPPYNQIGDKLLAAYADFLAGDAKAKQQAGVQFARLAQKLKPPAKNRMLVLARSANEQAANQYFRAGKRALAQRALNTAARLTKGTSPEQRHNLAVMGYAGRKDAAVKALDEIKNRVPLASCNLAVHFESAGQHERAYRHWKECQARGAAYPGLKAIIESKKRFFEGVAP